MNKFVSEFYQRICKDDIIKDLKEEIQKIEEVKLFSSIHPGLLQQIDQFLKVRKNLSPFANFHI